jgi:hypothetical protein
LDHVTPAQVPGVTIVPRWRCNDREAAPDVPICSLQLTVYVVAVWMIVAPVVGAVNVTTGCVVSTNTEPDVRLVARLT